MEKNSIDKNSFEANFSVLTMSIASSAAMALGLAPDPNAKPGQAIQKDKTMAKFNIDLLLMLKEKTKGNLTTDESRFLEAVVSDLQIKYLQA